MEQPDKMIIQKIVSIMKDKLRFIFDEDMEKIESQPFFGTELNLQHFELAYLLMEVEKEFAVSIPESYLLDPGVKTIGDFVRYIQKAV